MIRDNVNSICEADLPRPRPPHIHRETSRHGKTTWYFRRGKGARVRLPDPYGSEEFWDAYHAAVAGEIATPRRPGAKSGTLAWLIGRYRDSASWAALSPATRGQRENILKQVIATAGDEPFARIERRDIAAARDRRKDTPFAALNFLKTMRGLFKWAVDAGFVDSNPAEGVKAPAQKKSDGFHVWTEDEITRFEKRWSIGTRERLALAILLYTGLRRGDAARLGRQHVKNGVITLRTEKTATHVYVPVLPELARIIAATKTGDLAFIATPSGKPMTKESFGNWFREACNEAGVPGSAHGLRKAGATRAANNGATVAQLEAIFGWEGGRMAALYTREADRARLAKQAIEKLAKPETGTSIPAPSCQVRELDEKSKQNQLLGLELAPRAGLEPATQRLTVACSTG
jgi:integrase